MATWKGSDDDALTVAITAACTAGTFGGPCDVSRMSAIGFSSGAYMTSRMAFNYPGDFKALAVLSGSYNNFDIIWASFRALIGSTAPPTRCVLCSTSCPCLIGC